MILVADAAPLIFLAKINQLSLIFGLFDADILIPAAVKNEVLGLEVPLDEERLLTGFLSSCRIPAQRTPTKFAKALSFADNSILTLAIEKQADLILSDDRLLRKTAAIEGFWGNRNNRCPDSRRQIFLFNPQKICGATGRTG